MRARARATFTVGPDVVASWLSVKLIGLLLIAPLGLFHYCRGRQADIADLH